MTVIDAGSQIVFPTHAMRALPGAVYRGETSSQPPGILPESGAFGNGFAQYRWLSSFEDIYTVFRANSTVDNSSAAPPSQSALYQRLLSLETQIQGLQVRVNDLTNIVEGFQSEALLLNSAVDVAEVPYDNQPTTYSALLPDNEAARVADELSRLAENPEMIRDEDLEQAKSSLEDQSPLVRVSATRAIAASLNQEALVYARDALSREKNGRVEAAMRSALAYL